MKCGRPRRFAAIFLLAGVVLGVAFGVGCESEPLKPMDEPLGSEDAHRAEERMRQNVEEMMEEARRDETPGAPADPNQ